MKLQLFLHSPSYPHPNAAKPVRASRWSRKKMKDYPVLDLDDESSAPPRASCSSSEPWERQRGSHFCVLEQLCPPRGIPDPMAAPHGKPDPVAAPRGTPAPPDPPSVTAPSDLPASVGVVAGSPASVGVVAGSPASVGVVAGSPASMDVTFPLFLPVPPLPVSVAPYGSPVPLMSAIPCGPPVSPVSVAPHGPPVSPVSASLSTTNGTAWKLTKGDEEKLDIFQTKCLRRILRIRWQQHVSNRKVLEMAGVEKISKEVRRRRWN
ncbi:vegetative cell wall protein gp1-like [Pygocentrus nattereri]|uniref:vegetative cell wall protein gp1-like n=1 Tax=Pygocentrus nattereri TaxID=42514 RepID=UPI001891A773|nr:vegetative cell wall protein gp1-like [Pygocentrus nattereri]